MKSRLTPYEAGWLTFLVAQRIATEREAREAMSRVAQAAIDRIQRRGRRRRRKDRQDDGGE